MSLLAVAVWLGSLGSARFEDFQILARLLQLFDQTRRAAVVGGAGMSGPSDQKTTASGG